MDSYDSENDWQPPSEAELKILQARRERSTKISKLMGEYLLKGYKMLGSSCSDCGTILMRDRNQQEDYCIACNELESDTHKDDPVMSRQAAITKVREQPKITSGAEGTSLPVVTPAEASGSDSRNFTGWMGTIPQSLAEEDPIPVVHQKLAWATEELKCTSNLDYSIQLCRLITCSAEALASLYKLAKEK